MMYLEGLVPWYLSIRLLLLLLQQEGQQSLLRRLLLEEEMVIVAVDPWLLWLWLPCCSTSRRC